MPIDEIKALKAVSGERYDHVAQDRDQGARPQGDRTGEAEMVLRHADPDRRPDQRRCGLADAAGNNLGADRIGPDHPDRAMLLCRADRQDDAAARLEIDLDLRPGLQVQLHILSLLPLRRYSTDDEDFASIPTNRHHRGRPGDPRPSAAAQGVDGRNKSAHDRLRLLPTV